MAGGGGGGSKDGKKKARIEIIPLIDVIFFLLATFVLFTLSLNRIKTLPVDLPYADPKAQTKQDLPPDDLATIQVSDSGTVYWNKELISSSEVPLRIREFAGQWPDPKILIAGDDKAKFGPVITVLDEVRKAGIAKISVETRVRTTGR